jgi:hypothetical protein
MVLFFIYSGSTGVSGCLDFVLVVFAIQVRVVVGVSSSYAAKQVVIVRPIILFCHLVSSFFKGCKPIVKRSFGGTNTTLTLLRTISQNALL